MASATARLFRLRDGILFVSGASRGALLDTRSGGVYSINPEGCAVLRYETQDDPYWETLVSMGLAERAADARREGLPRRSGSDRLDFLWLEVVTDDCNERCAHCYADSMPRTYRRSLRKRDLPLIEDAPARPRLSHADWLALLAEASALGARACQLIGGEPFLYRGENGETLLDLVAAAQERGFETVEIFTNATLITPEKARRIKELGARIAVSLYSTDPAVHDGVTRLPGSHAKTMKALHLLKELGVPTRAEMVLMASNQHTVDATLSYKREQGWGDRGPDPLRPKGRGDDPTLMPDFENLAQYGLILEANFKADRKTVAHYSSGHSCLMGKLAVTEHGDVLPCIFTRNHVMGNVLAARGLTPIVHGQALRRMWSATKDQVLVCRDCEYRYVCFDCRPLSEAAAEGRADYLHAPYPRCTYNPYTGEWAAGLWKVDEEGRPYYDRSRAAQIKEVMSRGATHAHQPSGH